MIYYFVLYREDFFCCMLEIFQGKSILFHQKDDENKIKPNILKFKKFWKLNLDFFHRKGWMGGVAFYPIYLQPKLPKWSLSVEDLSGLSHAIIHWNTIHFQGFSGWFEFQKPETRNPTQKSENVRVPMYEHYIV